jgi:adhesin transport system membrane fusion protein
MPTITIKPPQGNSSQPQKKPAPPPSSMASELHSPPSRRLFWAILAAVAAFFVWASLAQLDEVAVGQSKVVPLSRSQIIQSLDGGIVAELFVHEGDIVQQNQLLAQLDPAMAQATTGEARAKIIDLKARAARLQAAMDERTEIKFPDDVLEHPEIVARERAAMRQNQSAINQTVSDLSNQRNLAQRKFDLAKPLLETGAANEVEILNLQQQVADLTTRINSTRNEYMVALKRDYSQTMSELAPLEQVVRGRTEQLNRTEIHAPTKGIVQAIRISTIGGVVTPGGVLMEITPLDDQLLIEARINPRDIAFIHPGQEANIKITAYDSSIYGMLTAKVVTISPDSVLDDVDRRNFYYRVFLRTEKAYLKTDDGVQHAIIPGMVATAEIRTGHRSVLSYLAKPLNKAAEALRER